MDTIKRFFFPSSSRNGFFDFEAGDFFKNQLTLIQRQLANMIMPSQNGQKPLPGVPLSSKPIFSKRPTSGFQEGGSPLFHIKYSENNPNIKAVMISALRISHNLKIAPAKFWPRVFFCP